ncbi:unnamed protein product [Paramecium primaurelia]|uniref:EF-hand domain-containing protein n=1 Tax=Paramecium primaurelia TaxID=5886 RepID=A0A8S1KP44_PARPR|nr:unnamed protein product [Paramecium primaurelia]
MGNYFRTVPKGPLEETLINFLKTRKLQHINDCIEMINDSYPTKSTLILDEYLDVFGGILEEWTEQVFLLLENNQSSAGQVDIYESLAVIIVFCGEEFNTKLEFIYKMFDFDQSGEIEKKELIMTLQASIRALCKIAKLQPPELKDLEYFAEKMFIQLDSDRSASISFHEFSIWLLNSWELQDFMLQYALIQTFENADRRAKEKRIFFQKLYESAAGGTDQQYCDADSIKTLFLTELKEQKKDTIELLIDILIQSTKIHQKHDDQNQQYPNGILKEAYEDIMAAWSAFDASDINSDNQTSIQELKFLLYAYEGDKPDLFRIKEEMKILDKDNSGYVSREEWIQYLCVEDKGKFQFRGNLKQLFNKYDKDNSGALSIPEIKQLLTDSMKDMQTKFKLKGQNEHFEEMVDQLAQEVVDDLNSENDKQSNDKTLTWIEFKNYMDQAVLKLNKLKDFLKSI